LSIQKEKSLADISCLTDSESDRVLTCESSGRLRSNSHFSGEKPFFLYQKKLETIVEKRPKGSLRKAIEKDLRVTQTPQL